MDNNLEVISGGYKYRILQTVCAKVESCADYGNLVYKHFYEWSYCDGDLINPEPPYAPEDWPWKNSCNCSNGLGLGCFAYLGLIYEWECP